MKTVAVIGGQAGLGGSFTYAYDHRRCAELLGVAGQFNADATVGTRILVVEVLDPNNNMLGTMLLGSCAASGTFRFAMASSVGGAAPEATGLGGVTYCSGPVPCRGLMPGWRVRVRDVASISAADGWSNMGIAVCIDEADERR